jgi:glutamyl-tRNA synthetase
LEIYKQVGQKLINDGFAYEKDNALWLDAKAVIDRYKIDHKLVPVFSKQKGESKTREGYLIKLPEKDLILGENSGVVEDFVLIRSNGVPVYHFAVVIDDEEMEISHVIRGQDHFSNTPKQYLIQKALGYKVPLYAHIPLILAPDRTKLSKRHGAVSISEYKQMGYLPEALINFMVFLGWNPKTDEEIFSLKELVERFTLEGINKSAATFDIKKLNYFNGIHIRKLSDEELAKKLITYNPQLTTVTGKDKIDLEKIASVIKERMTKLDEFEELTKYFFEEPKYDAQLLIFKKSTMESTLLGLQFTIHNLQSMDLKIWQDKEKLNEVLKKVVIENKLSNGDVFWPVRVALSGREASPPPNELLWVFGKEESIKRIEKAIKLLK